MIQSWENLMTDRRIDRPIDDSDFIGRCETNVERPINHNIIGIFNANYWIVSSKVIW